MFKGITDHFGSFLVSLLSIQSVASALALEKTPLLEKAHQAETQELATRTSDRMTIVHEWHIGPAIGNALTCGLLITAVGAAILSYNQNKPDPNKICGKSTVADQTIDGVDYEYYVYTYTTGDNCDTTQRSKTIIKKLSDAFDQLNADGASATCIDFDHHGTWHGVLGLVTKASGKDPQTVCDGHHAGAKRENAQIEGTDAPAQIDGAPGKRNEVQIVKRTSISVSETNIKQGATTFNKPNRVASVINEIAGKMFSQSSAGSCAGVSGTLQDLDGQSYTYYYEASGRNCDTTAEIKTMVTALDNAWEDLGRISALCMTMRHGGGTWRGHLGLSAMQGDFPATQLC